MPTDATALSKLNRWRLLKLKNFGGLVLLCIEADFCVQIRIFQHFRDLQDSHTFAPFQIQKIDKFSSNFLLILSEILQNFAFFPPNFVIVVANFDGFFLEFHELPSETVEIDGYFKNSEKKLRVTSPIINYYKNNNWGLGVQTGS